MASCAAQLAMLSVPFLAANAARPATPVALAGTRAVEAPFQPWKIPGLEAGAEAVAKAISSGQPSEQLTDTINHFTLPLPDYHASKKTAPPCEPSMTVGREEVSADGRASMLSGAADLATKISVAAAGAEAVLVKEAFVAEEVRKHGAAVAKQLRGLAGFQKARRNELAIAEAVDIVQYEQKNRALKEDIWTAEWAVNEHQKQQELAQQATKQIAEDLVREQAQLAAQNEELEKALNKQLAQARVAEVKATVVGALTSPTVVPIVVQGAGAAPGEKRQAAAAPPQLAKSPVAPRRLAPFPMAPLMLVDRR